MRRILRSTTRALIRYTTPRQKPTAIVIGVQKSGTTSLYNYLACHPLVRPTFKKEIDFFDCDKRYQHGTLFYHSHFPGRNCFSKNDSFCFDISPSYTASVCKAEKTAQRIYKYNSSIKLIVLLRNPVLRAFSAWNMYRILYASDPEWYFKWAKRDNDLINHRTVACRDSCFGKSFDDDVVWELTQLQAGNEVEAPILKLGYYHEILEPYFCYFPASLMQVLFTEDMNRNSASALKQIADFTGLPSFDWTTIDLRRHNEGNCEKSPSTDSIILLEQFYRDANTQLQLLLNRQLPW